jgi:ABC-type transport system involved in multi-copper enzyme maturation permease subunit
MSVYEIMGSRHIIQSLSFYRPMDSSVVLAAFFYCVVYCAVILSISIAVFSRRDFK